MAPQIQMRLVVVDPPADTAFAIQRGRADLLPPVQFSAGELVFEFALTVADADAQPPRLTGLFAQGPPGKRFVYLNAGSMAGQAHSGWRRRAKVPLYSISSALLNEALDRKGAWLVARIAGSAADGGPPAATVSLLSPWAVETAA